MISDSQRLYIEEVLGTTLADYRTGTPRTESEAVAIPTIVVQTPPLGPDGRALLVKILGSVKVEDYRHVESDDAVPATHLLHFAPGAKPGRSITESGTYWGFHDLDRLLGPGPEVTQLKREVWTLLQAFAKEMSCT